MKYFISILTFFLCASCLYAADQKLFDYSPDSNRGKDHPPGLGGDLIQMDDDLFKMPVGSELKLDMKGHPGYLIVHDNKIFHDNGDISWFGYFKGNPKGFRVCLIKGKGVIRGRILTPEGKYRITSKKDLLYLESVDQQGLLKGKAFGDDALVPDVPLIENHVRKIIAASDDNSKINIDIMILYNQAMVDKYPGTQLETRINELVGIANQACTDSNVFIHFRLVHTEQVQVSNTISNNTALSWMTDGSFGFVTVPSLRRQYGADLVILLRPYDSFYHGGCGIAWLNGSDGTDISLYADTGYCVVSEGNDGIYFCDDYSLAHEMGHNLGCSHDRDHASSPGAYPYSYGYDVAGWNAFGTVMSYDEPTLGYYSNPDINQCNGQPCGVEITKWDAANNALSMNNTRIKVAAFMNEVISDETQESVNITGMDIDLMSGPDVNEAFKVSVAADNSGNQTLYYRFYAKAEYGSDNYETSAWQVLQDYSTSNQVMVTVPQSGNYILTARVVLNPEKEPEALPIIGQAITVGDPAKVFIRSINRTPSTSIKAGETVTFKAQALTLFGNTIYYKFFIRENYGTSKYESSPWTIIQDYSIADSCQYVFPDPGDYIVVVRAVTDPFDEPEALPIVGMVLHVE